MKPILSIVIANYNYGRFLEDAIQSVVAQDGFEDCELIVVDGGSTDNSVEIIKKFADRIAWWVSAKDKGQSDAFNKGFAHANGKYLTWLNADDVFHPGCLGKVVSALKKHGECEWFTANFYRVTNAGRVIEIGWGPHVYPQFLQTKKSPVVVFGPASIFSKKILDAVGGMDVSCHYAMDTDLWVKFIVRGIKQRRINTFVWLFRMHEDSKTAEFGEHRLDDKHFKAMCAEERRIYQRAGYARSRARLFLIRILRLIDGSFIRLLFLRLAFRAVLMKE